jgi:RNA polymerase sigma-70 factor, ECF subfamily
MSQAGGTGARGSGEGAAAEFERLYRANVDAVTAYFARRSADPHVVADLTADTFVTAITSFGSFDPGRGTVRAWVFGIARHVYAAHCEAYGQQQDRLQRLAGRRDLEPDQVEELLDRIDAERAGRDLVSGLGMLPDRDRALVELVDLAGGGALAVAGAVAGAPAAYAVTKNPGGTITLAVYQQSGIAGANARLHTLGDKQVVVVPIEQGCTSKVTPPAVSGKGHQIATGISRSPNGTITVNAHGIPAGDILVIGVATSGHTSYSVGTLTSPPAPSCVGTPPLPPGNGGSGSTGGSGS